MRRMKAFTLVELLVVISIIALLVGTIMPTLNNARELARRATCSANLGAIGKSAGQYATDNHGGLPYERNDDVAAEIDRIGYQADQENPDSWCSNTRVWYRLVRDGLNPGAFKCPSDRMAEAGPSGNQYFDFPFDEGKRRVSYSMQVQLGSSSHSCEWVTMDMDGAGSLVIAADRNGLIELEPDTGGGYWHIKGSPAGATGNADDNSANHKEEGQNIVRMDGSVSWETTPACGYEDDNIYSHGGPATVGSKPSDSARPANEQDSYLAP